MRRHGSRITGLSGKPNTTLWKNILKPRQARRRRNGNRKANPGIHARGPPHVPGAPRKSLRRVDPARTARAMDVQGRILAHRHSSPTGHPDGPQLHPGSPETEVTVEFFARGNSTEVVLTHAVFGSAKDRDDHRQGWNGCLDLLAKALRSTP